MICVTGSLRRPNTTARVPVGCGLWWLAVRMLSAGRLLCRCWRSLGVFLSLQHAGELCVAHNRLHHSRHWHGVTSGRRCLGNRRSSCRLRSGSACRYPARIFLRLKLSSERGIVGGGCRLHARKEAEYISPRMASTCQSIV